MLIKTYVSTAYGIPAVKVKSVEHCCNKMEESYMDDWVIFDQEERATDKTMNIQKCFLYPEGSFMEYRAIRFCPFCGKEIVIEGGE